MMYRAKPTIAMIANKNPQPEAEDVFSGGNVFVGTGVLGDVVVGSKS